MSVTLLEDCTGVTFSASPFFPLCMDVGILPKGIVTLKSSSFIELHMGGVLIFEWYLGCPGYTFAVVRFPNYVDDVYLPCDKDVSPEAQEEYNLWRQERRKRHERYTT